MVSARLARCAPILLFCLLIATACRNPEAKKLDYLQSGNKYAAEKRYDHAIVEYANAIRIDPKFGEAHLKLAETYEQMQNLPAAFGEYVRAADALPDNHDVQLKAIGVLLLARRFDDAKARAGALLKKDPKDVPALLLMANAMAELNDTEGAVKQVEEAIRIKPDSSDAFINLGTMKARGAQDTQAEQAFREAVRLAPSSVTPQLALANYLVAKGKTEEAERAIKDALAINPSDLLANRMLATLYMGTKRAELAEAPLKAMADAHADTPAARLALADYYLQMRRYADARQVLNALAAVPSAASDVEYRLAEADYAESRTEQAHQRLDALLKRAPKYTPGLVLKARWLAQEGKLDDALPIAKSAVENEPESASANYALATVYDLRHETAAAIKAYQETLRLNPRAVDAQVQLSRLSLATGSKDAAVQYAEIAKQTAPNRVDARIALARGLLTRGELSRAEAEIAQLLAAVPNEASVHTLNATARFTRGDMAGATKAFERALELKPGSPDALAGLAAVYIRAKDTPRAVARVDGELAKRPDDPQLLAVASQVYVAAGDLPKAESALKRAVSQDPKFSAGYALLGQLYLSQKRLDEARAEFEGIAKRDPSSTTARTMVGVILEAQNKRDEAKKRYEDTNARDEKAAVVGNNLAFIYADEGSNLETALHLASTAKQGLPDDPNVDDTLGWVYYKRNMPSLAVRPLEDSVRKAPSNAVSQYHLGLTYSKLGQADKSRAALEAALKLDPKFPGSDVARATLAALPR